MVRQKKIKCKKAEGSKPNPCNDIHLSDYANANLNSKVNSRVRKCAGVVKSQDMSDLNWYEKDFDGDDEAFGHGNVSEKKEIVTFHVNKEYDQYPFDLWMLISSYISPEDVGRFALICKQARDATKTASFWKNLYFSHYDLKKVEKPDLELPDQLYPECVHRLQGLRARVIRSLFHTYQPFITRVGRSGSGATSTSSHLDSFNVESLNGSSLLTFWYVKEREATSWLYHFKFQKYSTTKREVRRKYNSLGGDPDLLANSEESCHILVAKCRAFTPIAAMLSSVKLRSASVVQRVDVNSLRLVFDGRGYSTRSLSSSSSANHLIIDIANIQSVQVFPWWHPSYPVQASYHPKYYCDI